MGGSGILMWLAAASATHAYAEQVPAVRDHRLVFLLDGNGNLAAVAGPFDAPGKRSRSLEYRQLADVSCGSWRRTTPTAIAIRNRLALPFRHGTLTNNDWFTVPVQTPPREDPASQLKDGSALYLRLAKPPLTVDALARIARLCAATRNFA